MTCTYPNCACATSDGKGRSPLGWNVMCHFNEQRFTFDELIEHGKANGANMVNEMPWSFKVHATAVTHENDRCYLILVNDPPHTLRMEPGDALFVSTKYPARARLEKGNNKEAP